MDICMYVYMYILCEINLRTVKLFKTNYLNEFPRSTNVTVNTKYTQIYSPERVLLFQLSTLSLFKKFWSLIQTDFFFPNISL